MTDRAGAVWRKSTRSGGGCVEGADNLPGVVAVRDSTDAIGLALAATPGAWSAFPAQARRTSR